jgi:hypothetical protein
MVKLKIVLIAFFIPYCCAQAQIVEINSTIPVDELIKSHLFEGCIEVSNVNSNINGSINGLTSFGTFAKSTSNFPFDNGIILSTGNANSAGNSVNTNDLNEGDENWGTDSDF